MDILDSETDAADTTDAADAADAADTANKKPKEILQKNNSNEFYIDMFSGNMDSDIRAMHSVMGSTGDTQISNRMKYLALQPQVSADARASYNKYSLQPYLDEELRQNENRDWWDDNRAYDTIF